MSFGVTLKMAIDTEAGGNGVGGGGGGQTVVRVKPVGFSSTTYTTQAQKTRSLFPANC